MSSGSQTFSGTSPSPPPPPPPPIRERVSVKTMTSIIWVIYITYLPLQFLPSPSYPFLQRQICDPSVLVHKALILQLFDNDDSHSSISETMTWESFVSFWTYLAKIETRCQKNRPYFWFHQLQVAVDVVSCCFTKPARKTRHMHNRYYTRIYARTNIFKFSFVPCTIRNWTE